MMKTLLSTVAALAVMTVAGAAMAQDAPAADSSTPPAKHHHMKKTHKATEAAAKGEESAEMHGRTEHGGPPSSPKEKAETEKLNEQQLAGQH